MRTVLIIHGIQGHAGVHWQKWLHDELVNSGYKVLMPTLPRAMRPDRSEWLETTRKMVSEVNFSELSIVGHSLGVVTGLDLVEAENKEISRLVTVSGFGKGYGAELNDYFLKERNIDFLKLRSLVKNVVVLYGSDDPFVPQDTLKDLAVKFEVEPIVVESGGHLNTDSGFTKFPLLLELLEK